MGHEDQGCNRGEEVVMACEICGRSSCTRCFHSIEDQERFDARKEMSDDVETLREELQSSQETEVELNKLIDSLREEIGVMEEMLPS